MNSGNAPVLPFPTPDATAQPPRGNYRRTLTDYRDLERALLVGNLAAAREAFARLQADSPALAAALSHPPFPVENSHLKALKSLGRYLLTGNLTGAKRAFQQFH